MQEFHKLKLEKKQNVSALGIKLKSNEKVPTIDTQLNDNQTQIPKATKFYIEESSPQSQQSPLHSTASSIVSSPEKLKHVQSQPILFGTRVQRQPSMIDWGSSRIGIRKKSFSPRSVDTSSARSPAASFLRNLSTSNFPVNEGYEIGDEIGEYTLTKEISHTQHSTVFCAKSPNGLFCVKIIQNENDLIKSMEHEIEVWSRLNHPYILKMQESIYMNDCSIIVSEFAPNGTMLDYIKDNGTPGLPENQLQILSSQIAQAIFYLHDLKIIHHDIKLENILICEHETVKLCDFGMAQVESDDHPSSCAGICCRLNHSENNYANSLPRTKDKCRSNDLPPGGSVHYLAPEQLQAQHTSYPHDMWSLGCVYYAMAVGKLPFHDNFLPKLQMLILAAKYNYSAIRNPNMAEIIRGLLCVNVKDRTEIQKLLKYDWILSMEDLIGPPNRTTK